MKSTNKTYSSTKELIRQTADSVDRDVVEAIEDCISKREIISYLVALRAANGKSQKDIAGAMQCTQGRISKLESGCDDDLRLGDFRGYLSALGLTPRFVVAKSDQTVVNEIKFMWSCLGRELNKLLDLAHDDPDAAIAIGKWSNELTANYMGQLMDFVGHLPEIAQAKTPTLRMIIQDATEEPKKCDSPASVKRFRGPVPSP